MLSCPSPGTFGEKGWHRAARKIREHYRRHASVTVYQLRLSFQARPISKPASLRTLRMRWSVNL